MLLRKTWVFPAFQRPTVVVSKRRCSSFLLLCAIELKKNTLLLIMITLI